MGQIAPPVLRAYEGTGSLDGKQRRRLEEIGAQAARVAHELKVPLSLIDGSLQAVEEFASGTAQYMRMAAPSDVAEAAAVRAQLDLDYLSQQAPALFDICRNGIRRLHVLIEQLEDYARGVQRTMPRTPVDLGELLREAINLAAAGRTSVPAVHAHLEATATLYGDAHALSRVFINLIGNAFDAVAGTQDPCVWVTVVEPHSAGCAGVEVHVRDNGPGVPAGMEARIFRPFVSTKPGHSGLGLGLAIVKSIVEQHGGTITLRVPNGVAEADVEPNPGAEFVVRLPMVAQRDSRPESEVR